MKTAEAKDAVSDKISELPQDILQSILYLLPQNEAVRTCVLSKSWRYVWCTRVNLDFSDTIFKGSKQDFLSTLDNTLQRYCDQRLCLEEFHLCISLDYLDHISVSFLERWIPKLTNMGVKEFRLFIYSKNLWKRRKRIKLPSVVFEAETLQDLQVERLVFGSKTINERTVLPKHLKKLHLEEVNITDEILEKIISSCPLIETMFLKSCNRLRKIPANTLRHLKHLTFSSRPSSEEEDCDIEIYAPSIETIDICNTSSILFQKGADFRNLNSLILRDVQFCLDHFSSCKFPSLEKLDLLRSYGYGLDESIEEPQLVIDAPNIKRFQYLGDWDSLSPISISFAATSREWSSNLSLFMTDAPSSWLLKLHKLLESLSRSETSLAIYQIRKKNEDIFQENLDLVQDLKDNCGNRPAVVLDTLNLMIGGDVSYFSLLTNMLFCFCRPRTLVNLSYVDSDPGSVLKSLMQGESGNYQHQLRQLWLPYLEEVSLEIYDENLGEYQPTSLSDLPDDDQGKHIYTRFALKWREDL